MSLREKVEQGAAKALPWLEFWGNVLPFVQEAVQALYRSTDGDPVKARAKLREVKDQWGDTDAENDAFRERLAAVEDEEPADQPEPKPVEEYPEVLEGPPDDNETDNPR